MIPVQVQILRWEEILSRPGISQQVQKVRSTGRKCQTWRCVPWDGCRRGYLGAAY